MSDESSIRTNQHVSADPAAAVLVAQQLWQLPLTLYASWWDAGVEALSPPVHPHHAVHHDEHGQLVIPEPIEEDGEHGLFA